MDDNHDNDKLVNLTEQVAATGRPLTGIGLVLSGHVHIFATATFGAERPAQIIVGDGGANSNFPLSDGMGAKSQIDHMQADAFAVQRHGYFVLDATDTDKSGRRNWTGTLYAPDDRLMAACRVSWRSVACKPA